MGSLKRFGMLGSGLLVLVAAAASADDPRETALESARGGAGLKRLSEADRVLIARPDFKRPQRELTLPLFGRPLTVGMQYTLRGRYFANRLLREEQQQKGPDECPVPSSVPPDLSACENVVDQLRLNQGLKLDFFYPITSDLSLFVGGKVTYRDKVYSTDDRKGSDFQVERDETWLYYRDIADTGFNLQVGRQRLNEEREWWWDQNLDAVRLSFDASKLHFEVAVAQRLGKISTGENHIDPEEEDVLRILGMGSWEWSRRHTVSLFALHQRDHSTSHQSPSKFDAGIPPSREDDSDANLTWFGLRAEGRFRLLRKLGAVDYWLDAAGVEGHEKFQDYLGPDNLRRVGTLFPRHSVRGFGFDVGGTWRTALPMQPALTLGYAYGSGRGGRNEDGAIPEENDGSFRQTGLQDNNVSFSGVDRFRLYGELLDPELSNLHIVTVALGLRVLQKSSIEFVYHHYRQVRRADFLRDHDFKRDPNGLSRRIGDEWDLVIGIEEWEHVEVELIGAIFRAGAAFEGQIDDRQGKLSYLAAFQVRLNF